MTSTLFQNILPEDIPVMLKRLNAYTKSYQKEEYIKHAGDPADFIGIIESGSVHILQDDYYGNRNLSPRIPCLGRLLPVQEFHIFPWILWQQRTVQ